MEKVTLAASKIHSQWFEFYDNQTKELQERVEELESELKLIKTKRTNYLSFLKQRNELKNDNIKLQAKIDELESVNNDLKQAMIRGSELNDKLKFD